jgi:hypothetical protein
MSDREPPFPTDAAFLAYEGTRLDSTDVLEQVNTHYHQDEQRSLASLVPSVYRRGEPVETVSGPMEYAAFFEPTVTVREIERAGEEVPHVVVRVPAENLPLFVALRVALDGVEYRRYRRYARGEEGIEEAYPAILHDDKLTHDFEGRQVTFTVRSPFVRDRTVRDDFAQFDITEAVHEALDDWRA